MTKVTITIEGGSSGQPPVNATAMGDRTGKLLCSKAMKVLAATRVPPCVRIVAACDPKQSGSHVSPHTRNSA